MNKTLLYPYLFLLFLTFQLSLYGQPWQGKRVKSMPRVYLDPGPTGEEAPENSHGSNEFWSVYSDRDSNICYNEPNGIEIMKLPFMNPCYAIDERDGFLELIKFDNSVIDIGGRIKRDPIYYGWVSKSKLLLWNSALVDRKTYFPLKALLTQKASSVASRTTNNPISIYSSPTNNLMGTIKNNGFQYLFVYKVKGEYSLVGSTQSITILGNNINKNTILGWVANYHVQLCVNRLFLTPNTNKETVKLKKNTGIKATVFATKKAAEDYQKGLSVPKDQILWDEYEKQAYNDWYKLPVFEEENGIVHTAILKNEIRTNPKVNDSINKYRNTNLVFAIDIARVRGVYCYPFIQSIKNNIDTFRNLGINLKVGIVLYRDYIERNCPEGDILTQNFPLGNPDDALTFLQNVLDKGQDRSCLDKDSPSALFYGIIRAASMLNGHSWENNAVILIGDVGNGTPDNEGHDVDECISLLAKNNCSFAAYQVRKGANTERFYEDFDKQTADILKGVMSLVHSKIKEQTGANLTPSIVDGETHGIYHYTNSVLEGTVHYVDISNSMPPIQLKKDVDVFISKMRNRTQILGGATLPISKETSHIGTVSYLVEGYTNLKTNSLELYEYELLMKDDELSGLIVEIQHLLTGGKGETLEGKLSNMCREIINKYSGQGETAINDMTITQLDEYVTNLPPSNTSCDLLTRVKDIPNMEMQEVNDIFNCMGEKYEKLKQLQRDRNHYFTTPYGYYYWIPQSIMP